MSPDTVKHIVCAVRGRPESRTTVTRAVDLALEHQAHLTFLHMIDAEFLRKQLRQFAIDTQADLMIMGAPTPGPGKNVFKQEELKQFIREMEQESNLRIIQIAPTDNPAS
jgi:hypothetical protein